MKVKGVIFDLDGTLINSLEDITDSLNRVLKRHSLPVHSIATIREWIGQGAQMLIKKALVMEKPDDDFIKLILGEYREEYMRNCTRRTYVYQGIPDLLSTLSAKGIQMNVLSNKPHELTREVCQHFFRDWNFRIILGQRDQVPRKPDPSAALEIAKNIGVKAENIMYIGDSGVDMETGRNAGMVTVAVTWGFRPKNELLQYKPDVCIDEPADLVLFLNGRH